MSEENNIIPQEEVVRYDDDNIRHLSDMEHVRTRPGMYIALVQECISDVWATVHCPKTVSTFC